MVHAMKRNTIVLADDHPLVIEQLRELLSTEFDVVAAVRDGRELIAAAQLLKPDVVVTDISMPDMDGMLAAKRITLELPDIRIVFVTMHDNAALAKAALNIGHGYVLKSSAGEELIDAVQAVLEHRRFLSRKLGDVDSLA